MRRAALLTSFIVITAACSAYFLLRSRPLAAEAHIDLIVVHKRDHTMAVFDHGRSLKTYRIALGRGGLAPKERAGDNRVPEGEYTIAAKNAHSGYHRALRVSYPTPTQAAAARANGFDPGGDIMIHGVRNSLGWLGPFHRIADWTKGCVAVTDDEIDELLRAVPVGTRVTIEK